MTGTRATERDEEADLVGRLQAGDDAAFEQVVRDYGGRMLAATRRIMWHEENAREAAQDAMLMAFKAIGDFKADARLGTWLHRIAVNAALMKLRSMRRRPEQSIEPLLPQFAEDGHRVGGESRWSEQADVAAERAETRQMVRDKIDELPEDYRTVLLLRDIEQLDTQQTADLLDVSTSVVKTRLHRARQALRALLDPHLSGASA